MLRRKIRMRRRCFSVMDVDPAHATLLYPVISFTRSPIFTKGLRHRFSRTVNFTPSGVDAGASAPRGQGDRQKEVRPWPTNARFERVSECMFERTLFIPAVLSPVIKEG